MTELAAVVLAAGASSRLGRPKPFEKLHGRSLIRLSTELALGVTSRVIVVAGAEYDRIARELTGTKARVLHHRLSNEGLASSVRAGANAADSATIRAWLFLTCDQYRLRPVDLDSLVRAWREDPDRPFAARYREILGIPAIWPIRLRNELDKLQGDRGLGGLLRARETGAVDMPTAGFDLDTEADVEALRHFENRMESDHAPLPGPMSLR